MTVRLSELPPGRQAYHVGLRSNDPTRPISYVTLSVLSPYRVQAQPERLSFYFPPGTAVGERRTTVTAPPGVHTQDASSTSKLFRPHLELATGSEAGSTWEVRVTAQRPEPSIRKVDALLVIRAIGTNNNELTVPLVALAPTQLRATPSALILGTMPRGEAHTATVAVSRRDSADFVVHAVDINIRGLRVDAQPSLGQRASRHTLRISVVPESEGPLEGRLRVDTRDPTEESVSIPFVAFVR